MAIKIRDVNYIYESGTPWEIRALDGIDLTIEDCTVFGIMGSIGSGKSTLASLIAGLDAPTSGSISIDGSPPCPGMNIGILFQHPEDFFFHSTLMEDIACSLSRQQMPQVRARILHAFNLLGLDEKILERSPFQLSIGERRLAALASLLAAGPGYLVLDEPTASLDWDNRNRIFEVVRSLSSRVTIIYISHKVQEVLAVSDLVAVLDGGRVSFTGSRFEYLEWAEGDRLPELNRIMQVLRKKGIQVDVDVTDVDEAVRQIRGFLEGAG